MYTLNANMADCSVGTRHKSHESEASQSSMFCCDNVYPENLTLLLIWSALFRGGYELEISMTSGGIQEHKNL